MRYFTLNFCWAVFLFLLPSCSREKVAPSTEHHAPERLELDSEPQIKIPSSHNPLYILELMSKAKLTEKDKLFPYVDLATHACNNLYHVACALEAPPDPDGKVYPLTDLKFAASVLKPQQNLMTKVYAEWDAFTPAQRKELDTREGYVLTSYAERAGLNKQKDEVAAEVVWVKKVAISFGWLPRDAKDELAKVKTIEEFGGSWDTLFGSGLAYSGDVLFHGNFLKFTQSRHARVFAIAHELGHSIQFTKFGEAATKCLRTNLKLQLGKVIEGNVENEVFADWFGHHVFAKYLTALEATGPEKQAILANAFRSFCGEIPEETNYPASPYRVNFALSNPGLNDLACADYKEKIPERNHYCDPEKVL